MLPEEMSAFAWSADINLYSLFINMIIGGVLSSLLRLHYAKFGSVLSNRDELGHIFPMITLTIILIISIVKSSLALSLGLVGALSIVRFRTPIKEPEELGYLFLCIAIGLGLGASQKEATILCFLTIVTLMTISKWDRLIFHSKRSLHLLVQWASEKSPNSQGEIKRMNKILSKYTKKMDLRRFDSSQEESEASYILDLNDQSDLDSMIAEVKKEFKASNVVLIDQKNLPKL